MEISIVHNIRRMTWEERSCTHSGFLPLERDAEVLHSVDGHPQAVQNVVEDDNPPFLLLVL